MSEPTSKRQLLTGIEASGTFPVEYRFAHAKGGNRHLVVVFANFSAPDEYGWSNGVFDNLRANILWIRDKFHDNNSYYLCKEMDFSLERSVITLIFNVMKSLDLTPDNVTMWGGSKGGSAALYFGLRYGFRNIVSIVPQFLVGTYVQQKRPAAAQFMMGDGPREENVRVLDSIIPDLVRSEANRSANIYLFSSPQDEEYAEQVEPFLVLFQRYENFNFIYSESPFINNHTDVTRRNVPVLMGILNFLIDGIVPRIGFVRNGYEEPDRDRSAIDGYLAATSRVKGKEFPPPVVSAPAYHEEVHSTSVRLSGSAPGAVRVSLWENGKFLGSPPVAADGSWSWDPGRPWTKGKHLVRLFGVDPAGFHSERTEIPFTVSDRASAQGATASLPLPGGVTPTTGQGLRTPVVSMPAAHEQVMGATVGFTGVAGGAAQVGFRENGVFLGATAVSSDGRWSWDPGWAWNEGMHLVEVFSVDAAGVESPAAQVPFTAMSASAGAASGAYHGRNH